VASRAWSIRSPSKLQFLLRAALVLVLSISSTNAWSDDSTNAARRHFTRGQRAYNAGSYAEALGAFKQAYRRKPLPGFLFNLGQCHRKLGHDERALHYFSRYLRAGAEGPNRNKAKRLVAVLKRKQRKQRKQERHVEPEVARSADQPLVEGGPPSPARSKQERAPAQEIPMPSEVASAAAIPERGASTAGDPDGGAPRARAGVERRGPRPVAALVDLGGRWR